MAIKNIKAVVDDALSSTALKMIRDLSYQDLVNKITVEEKQLAEDILTLAQGMSMGNQRAIGKARQRARKQMKNFETELLRITRSALSFEKVSKKVKDVGFEPLSSEAEAYKIAASNKNTNYCAVFKKGTTLNLIFIRSYTGNAPGDNYLKGPGMDTTFL